MRGVLRFFFLLGAVAATAAVPCGALAQTAWWGDYTFRADYIKNSWDGYSLWTTQQLNGYYAIPLVDSRLGTVQLGTGLYWTRASLNGESGSASGLSHYDVALSLFPYRKFPLTFHYGRSQAGGLFGGPDWTSTRMGAGLNLRTRHFGLWWLSYEKVKTVQGDFDERLTYWRLSQNQTFWGRVRGVLEATSEDRVSYFGRRWNSRRASYEVTSRLPRNGNLISTTWAFRDDFEGWGARRYQERLFWSQPLRPGWQLVSWGTYQKGTAAGGEDRGYSVASSVLFQPGNWRYFAGGDYSNGQSRDTLSGTVSLRTTSYQGFGGATWFGPRNWQVTADAAFGSVNATGPYAPAAGSGSTLTLHAGATKGNGLPHWASSLAYAFRDISFERRLADQFPPGYATPELALLRQDYYVRTRSGASSFAVDLYHTQSGGGQVKSDALVAHGTLSFNHTLVLNTRLDWRRDASASYGGTDAKTLYGGANFNNRRGASTGLFLALSQYSRQGGTSVGPSASNLNYSLGASHSRVVFRRIPVSTSLIWSRYPEGGSYWQAFASAQLDYRDLHLNVLYSYTREPVLGTYTHRLSINLFRLFRGTAF